jgi:hypothetical protein
MTDLSAPSATGEVVLYQTDDGNQTVQVRLQDGTVWLTQKLIADLYQTSTQNISRHLTELYEEGEIAPESTIKSYLIVRTEGSRNVRRPVDHYTAAELIHERADSTRPNMGLTTWKNAPSGKIRQADVTVAKNYLDADELRELNRIVTMYLDYAEDQARKRRPMHMADWIARLDSFLQFNERNVLDHAGKVSHELAVARAESEFDHYQTARRRIESETPSDFDRMVAGIEARAPRGRRRSD